ncbi:hypothetical protein NM688_g1616 [Phlebia brevispora]|uniref:Uncharacterized protein n=1 Tax=Phlebia brevispora TaxID=194682 RepID=A0ACC1TAU5_9APHY|nr:hypothetical protein NM688_g1616 [Phlebia brevispora]
MSFPLDVVREIFLNIPDRHTLVQCSLANWDVGMLATSILWRTIRYHPPYQYDDFFDLWTILRQFVYGPRFIRGLVLTSHPDKRWVEIDGCCIIDCAVSFAERVEDPRFAYEVDHVCPTTCDTTGIESLFLDRIKTCAWNNSLAILELFTDLKEISFQRVAWDLYSICQGCYTIPFVQCSFPIDYFNVPADTEGFPNYSETRHLVWINLSSSDIPILADIMQRSSETLRRLDINVGGSVEEFIDWHALPLAQCICLDSARITIRLAEDFDEVAQSYRPPSHVENLDQLFSNLPFSLETFEVRLIFFSCMNDSRDRLISSVPWRSLTARLDELPSFAQLRVKVLRSYEESITLLNPRNPNCRELKWDPWVDSADIEYTKSLLAFDSDRLVVG